jgi:hypothetical protein
LAVIFGDRKESRVRFEDGIGALMVGVDGTWRRDCIVADIADSGARLILLESMAGLNLKEFFLWLTPSGSIYRRCELIRVSGDELGVRFVSSKDPARKSRRPPAKPAGA